mmetsp:Transcript_48381/g.94540  ORF Transcript_48381/g.94540 Transcript_48381/m.94540 type:complete len:219 (-) Transcript_48381:401-1057(-)
MYKSEASSLAVNRLDPGLRPLLPPRPASPERSQSARSPRPPPRSPVPLALPPSPPCRTAGTCPRAVPAPQPFLPPRAGLSRPLPLPLPLPVPGENALPGQRGEHQGAARLLPPPAALQELLRARWVSGRSRRRTLVWESTRVSRRLWRSGRLTPRLRGRWRDGPPLRPLPPSRVGARGAAPPRSRRPRKDDRAYHPLPWRDRGGTSRIRRNQRVPRSP